MMMNDAFRIAVVAGTSLFVLLLELAAFQGLRATVIGNPSDTVGIIGIGVLMGSLPLGGLVAVRAVFERRKGPPAI
jgi:hypothetical protein